MCRTVQRCYRGAADDAGNKVLVVQGPLRQWSMRWSLEEKPCSMPHRTAWTRLVVPELVVDRAM